MGLRSKAEAEAVRHDAIVRLASARRETLAEQDLDVFCDGVAEFSGDVVRAACDELGKEAPADFEPRFPPLHVLRLRCRQLVDERRYATLKKLPMPKAEPPISAERMDTILAQIRAAALGKTWR
jgi:hypothetical protein